MDHEHFKTGPFCQGGLFRIGCDDFGNLFAAESLYGSAVGACSVAGAVLRKPLLFVLVYQIGARILP